MFDNLDDLLDRYPAPAYVVKTGDTDGDHWQAAHNVETARILAGDNGTVYTRHGDHWQTIRFH